MAIWSDVLARVLLLADDAVMGRPGVRKAAVGAEQERAPIADSTKILLRLLSLIA